MIANLRVGLETVSQVVWLPNTFLGEKKMTNEIKELKKEIIRLKSLCRRAADEIRDLDNIIIDFVEGNAFPQKNEDDLWAGESSINLLNRLDGKTNGGYIENYEDLHLEMKTLDGYAQIDHPDFYVSKNVREHNLQMLQEVAELTKLYSEGKYFQFLEGTKDLTPEQLVEVAPLLKPAMQKLRKQDDPDFHQNQEHPPECKWHKDWHACDCGIFDKEKK